uniref:Fibrinogen C-terminal domain-containing protein n=1 Tax=Amphimedon queenslandica TaxID=400682 RepID=A0A1X7VMJ6_AMPQE
MELMLNASITSINGRLNTTSQNMQSMETRIDLLSETQKITLGRLNTTSQNMQSMETRISETQKTTLNELYKKLNPSSLPRSCVEVLEISSGSPSGYYSLADPNGYPYSVYCYMDNFCNAGGGWKRVAKLDMKNSNENCPAELSMYHQDGKRACGRLVNDRGSCSWIIFPVNYEYSQVCGKVIGYQKGFPDGPDGDDGVILTLGTSQSHIWSFFASSSEEHSNCPCSSSPRAISVTSYIGSDYYCESAHTNGFPSNFTFLYTDDPLWDGQTCRFSEAACCKRPLIPWFHKKLGHTTTDYIEMRLCFNEGTHDEDSPVFQYEIYVK